MESVRLDRQRGQILVQVAIMVGVLFAFVALAVDAGNVYGGRRRMQNAADAGALAGARAICFPEDDVDPKAAAEEAAIDYAVQRNGAGTATVSTEEEYTVIVTAFQTLDTFFAGVIGINEADVRAEAAAVCGGTVAGGGTWPLSFRQEVYTDSVPCGAELLVFASKEDEDAVDWAPDCCDCENAEVNDSECDWKDDCKGTCVREAGITTTVFIGGGDRGWLLFENPEEPYQYPSGCSPSTETSCGNPKVACWLAEDYPGVIEQGDCVAGQPGVNDSVKDDVDLRVDDVVQIILWDRECDSDDPETLGDCPGTPYHVAGFGCVQVMGWEQSMKLGTCGSPATCASLHAVRARKICEGITGTVTIEGVSKTVDLYNHYCSSPTGATGGVPPEEWENKSVSLIQWPRP